MNYGRPIPLTDGPMTLRDVRRLMERRRPPSVFVDQGGLVAAYAAWTGVESAASIPLPAGLAADGPAIRRAVDRLISILGADYPLAEDAGRSKPAAPVVTDGEGEDNHGGDGNAAEMDNPAESRGDAPDGGKEMRDGCGCHAPGSDRADSPPESGSPKGEAAGGSRAGSGREPAVRDGEPGEDEEGEADRRSLTEGSDPTSAGDGDAGDVPTERSDAAGPRTATDHGGISRWATIIREPGSDGKRTPAPVWGGLHHDEAAAQSEAASLGRTGRRLAKALRRWFDAVDMGGIEETPRLSGRRLVRELTTRRVALGRARREEQDPSVLLVLVDVSGSCAEHADATLAAARLLLAADPRVVVVTHSNGVPWSASGAMAREVLGADLMRRLATGGVREGDVWHPRVPVAAALCFGDGDGAWLYRHLDAVCPVLWLDSYMCRALDAPQRRAQPPCWTGDWRGIYIRGVSGADGALAALSTARKP